MMSLTHRFDAVRTVTVSDFRDWYDVQMKTSGQVNE